MYSCSTLFTETDLALLFIYLFLIASETILSCLFFFYLIIYLYFLIPAVIAKSFTPSGTLAIPREKPPNSGNAEIERQPLITETKAKICPN